MYCLIDPPFHNSTFFPHHWLHNSSAAEPSCNFARSHVPLKKKTANLTFNWKHKKYYNTIYCTLYFRLIYEPLRFLFEAYFNPGMFSFFIEAGRRYSGTWDKCGCDFTVWRALSCLRALKSFEFSSKNPCTYSMLSHFLKSQGTIKMNCQETEKIDKLCRKVRYFKFNCFYTQCFNDKTINLQDLFLRTSSGETTELYSTHGVHAETAIVAKLTASSLHLTSSPPIITCSHVGLPALDGVTSATWLVYLYYM